jgi:hypothetical protein
MDDGKTGASGTKYGACTAITIDPWSMHTHLVPTQDDPPPQFRYGPDEPMTAGHTPPPPLATSRRPLVLPGPAHEPTDRGEWPVLHRFGGGPQVLSSTPAAAARPSN